MHSLIEENTNQIKALSVAQSEGLKRMQEINEMNTSQIKALADGQAKLQSLVDQNATHFIALNNSQFSNQEQLRLTLQHNADHVKSLAQGQDQLTTACKDMMGAITQLSQSLLSPNPHGSSVGPPYALSPPPRKLNRRIMGYTYETSDAGSSRNSTVETSALSTQGK